jgi:rod shape-determining protein MreC
MEILLNRFRNLTVLLLVIFAQLVLLAYQVKSNQDVRLIRVWAVTAVTPLARVLEFVRQNTIGVVENYIVLVNVREENETLKKELGETKLAVHFLRSELQSAERAEALRIFQTRTPSRTLPARIIGTGTGANSRVVYLDQGSVAGVMRGMAVVTPDGIVGKVIGAYPTASQVLLVTDTQFAAGVVSDKNKVRGTLEGLGQAKCKINYVQNEEKVDVGEVFYTSGDDRVFPRGLPAAKVVAVREGDTFKEIFVVPTGLQTSTEEVLIVLEGVHQALPSIEQPTDAAIYLAPSLEEEAPAKPGTGSSGSAADPGTSPASSSSAIKTEADRLRERYEEIVEQQGVVLGQGYKPPDFKAAASAKPKPPAAGPGSAARTRLPADAPVVSPSPQSNSRPQNGRDPVAAKPKPEAPSPAAGGMTAPGQRTSTTVPVDPPKPAGTTPGLDRAAPGAATRQSPPPSSGEGQAVRAPGGGSPTNQPGSRPGAGPGTRTSPPPAKPAPSPR